jgi:glycosyltransferase involved in cell wall biosynthesis
VNTRDFCPSSVTHHSESFTIGCFGRLTAQKNQALLIRALPLLRREVPEARLLLCGGGEDEAQLRALAERQNVSECVTWTGEVADARPFYARCDVVAAPSQWEGCPYAVLEAMACGLPVIGAPVGGVLELLSEDAGVLVHSHSARAWANALAKLWRNEDRRCALSEAAQTRVAVFTMERMVRETVQVYEGFCGDSR